MPDFSELLNKPLDDVKKPPTLPAGTYHCRLVSHELGETRSDKKTPYVRYAVQIDHAGDDVDQEALQGIDLAKRPMNFDFYLTPDSQFRLKDFMTSCGIQTAGRTFNETIPELIGVQVLATVIQQPSRDGKELYSNIKELVGAPS